MTQNKKVNAANAFEVDLNCLNNIQQFIKGLNHTTKWLRSGEAIGAGAKIYGYRVDNMHNEIYRMLNGMQRGKLEILEVELEGDASGDENI